MASKRVLDTEEGRDELTAPSDVPDSQLRKRLRQDASSAAIERDAQSQDVAAQAQPGISGNLYQSTAAQGHSSVVQGNIHGGMQVNHYHVQDSEKDKYTLLHNSLAFPRMGARVLNIDKELARTCQWIYSHSDYMAWKDDSKVDKHHGFFWIKGKPGCGKSTIMRMVYD